MDGARAFHPHPSAAVGDSGVQARELNTIVDLSRDVACPESAAAIPQLYHPPDIADSARPRSRKFHPAAAKCRPDDNDTRARPGASHGGSRCDRARCDAVEAAPSSTCAMANPSAMSPERRSHNGYIRDL